MRKKIVCKNVQKFQLLDICRERSKRSLWISFHFAICTSNIKHLPSPFSMEQQRWIIFRYSSCPSVKTIRREYRQKIDVPPFDVPGESLTIEQLMSDVNDFASQLDKDCQEGCQEHHLQSWLLLGQRRIH